MSIATNKALVERDVEAWNTADLAWFRDAHAASYTGHAPPMPAGLNGIEGFLAWFDYVHTGFPDMHVTMEEMVAEEDRVFVRYSFTGTQTGPLVGPTGTIPPTGKPLTYTGALLYHIVDGKIVSSHFIYDRLDVIQQLGALPMLAAHEPAAAA
jgi:predicted ester cyclase